MATAVCSPAKFFNQSGHRICGDFAWLLPKLTVEVKMIVSVKAAFEDHSSRRAVKKPGRNAEGSRIFCDLDFNRRSLRQHTTTQIAIVCEGGPRCKSAAVRSCLGKTSKPGISGYNSGNDGCSRWATAYSAEIQVLSELAIQPLPNVELFANIPPDLHE